MFCGAHNPFYRISEEIHRGLTRRVHRGSCFWEVSLLSHEGRSNSMGLRSCCSNQLLYL
uniref:Uncharacterized protein n=1 Tax=Physcomitrium patens TaxID=3218 RepID=A0A2K1L9R6_PHYPA|nr:hypothetical protein PHYPA_001188 [Physcomitrium patens]